MKGGPVATSIVSLSASTQNRPSSFQIALAAARTAHENKGQNIVVLDMRDQTPIFDYFVIVTGSSRRQLHAISEEIDHVLEKDFKDRRLSIEGYEDSHWILLDYGDIVVHLFDEPTRAYYDLEGLWGQARRIDISGELR
jgi:ribosome-associated protein